MLNIKVPSSNRMTISEPAQQAGTTADRSPASSSTTPSEASDEELQIVLSAGPEEVKMYSESDSLCVICLDVFDDPSQSNDCLRHPICDECFRVFSHSTIFLQDRTSFRCPGPGCDVNLEDSRRLPNWLREKLEDSRLKSSRVNRTCPGCHAKGSLKLGPLDEKLQTRLELECSACYDKFCLICCEKTMMDESTSRLQRALTYVQTRLRCGRRKDLHLCTKREHALLLESARNCPVPSMMFKPCPNCFELIQRSEGCRNMECTGQFGCGCRFCWDCLQALQAGVHACPFDISARATPYRYFRDVVRPQVKETLMNIIRGTCMVLSIPFVYSVQAYKNYQNRDTPMKRYAERLKFGPRVIGINLFNIPHEAIHTMLRRSCPDETRLPQQGRWSPDHQCFRSYTLWGDGHTIVNLHSHCENEPCAIIDRALIRRSMDQFVFIGRYVHSRLPLSHEYPENFFASLAVDHEIDGRIRLGLERAFNRFAEDVKHPQDQAILAAHRRPPWWIIRWCHNGRESDDGVSAFVI